MKKLLLLLTVLLTVTYGAVAQSRTVTGVVISESDGEPLPGATVMPVGQASGTSTDIDGKFSITVAQSVTKLTVSYVGMVTRNVDITSNYLTIRLMEADNTLNEVVVTGYGVTRKAAFTGAASVVGSDVVEKKPDVNFVKSLEGAVTGFQYNNSTSMPGQWGSVYIRGMGSLSSSSQPLYVIDGVPVNSDYDSMSSNNNYFDPMSAYNPADIESVTVLKDAAATAIYGSRAANGVIVITTKKGGESRLSVTLDVKQGFTSVANNNMNYADAQGMLDLISKGRVAAGMAASYDEAKEYFIKNYKNYGWDGVSSYDWFDKVTRKGYYQDYNVSLQGTTGATNYYVSLGYIDTDGITINSNNKRYSGRINLDSQYKFLTVGINASYSNSENHTYSQSTSGSMAAVTVGAITQMTLFYPFYNADGTDYNTIPTYNPLAVNDPDLGDMDEIKNQTINANPWLKVDFGYGVWFKTNFGANIMDQREYVYWSAIYNNQGKSYNGLGQQYNSTTTTLTWTNTLGWDYTFNENHNIDLMLGQEMQRYNYRYEYYCGYDFPFASTGMRDLSTAGAWNDSEFYKAESRLASYFGNANYNYANRYYASASFRRDGSSVFGSNKRWGNFWSVGAKWRLTEENFLKGNNIVTNAAIRASYGTVGNQSIPSLYAARGFYAAGYNYNGAPGMVPSQISNPDLTWETSKKFDVGFDLSLINRVSVTFDYYNDVTDDAIYKVPVSMTTGVSDVYRNIGKIRNRGVELGINGTVFTNRDITVNAFANFTFNRNKVLKLADGAVESTYTIIEEGRPYRQFYMKEYAGVDRETGRALFYKNATGDETTTDWNAAAKRYVGSAEPKMVGAFGVNATGYGVDLSIQFNYRTGGKVYDSGHNFTGWGMSNRTPLQTVVDNSWTPENKDAKYPQYVYGDPYLTTSHSTRFLMSGDYIRLSNIRLGYTFPAKLTRKAMIQKLRIYTTFDNIHTWTKSDFVGYNPETYASGVIGWQYPAVFTFTGGIQVTF